MEEPSLHLCLRPTIEESAKAYLKVPTVDGSKCNHCGAWSDLCQFKAICVIGQTILTFPDMCHGCGGCWAVCPEKAISRGQRELGEISWGRGGDVIFLAGGCAWGRP